MTKSGHEQARTANAPWKPVSCLRSTSCLILISLSDGSCAGGEVNMEAT